MRLVVSIVSHRHGLMLGPLVRDLLAFPEVSQIILTYNITEQILEFSDDRVTIIENEKPRGFGANHNAAFNASQSDYFCVLNPDIVFKQNPFPMLLSALGEPNVGLAAPLIVSDAGAPEDSMRKFITPLSIAKRVLGVDSGSFNPTTLTLNIYPDWVAGMFMLFNGNTYELVGGFNERYFMYCEDADICTRIWQSGFQIVGCLSVPVIHQAQRASRKFSMHLVWHITSLVRYFSYHMLHLPKISR